MRQTNSLLVQFAKEFLTPKVSPKTPQVSPKPRSLPKASQSLHKVSQGNSRPSENRGSAREARWRQEDRMARCRLRKPVSTCVSPQTVVVQGLCFRKGRVRTRCQVRRNFISLLFFCASWPTVFAHFFDICECFTLFKDAATIFSEKIRFCIIVCPRLL